MNSGEPLRAAACGLCGEAFRLPEDDVEGNLPRMLLCAHIYCTSCLLSLHRAGAIRCPQCEVVSSLPEGGVLGLQEDSRIIGLIYTSHMNSKRRRERAQSRSKQQRPPSHCKAPTEDRKQPADLQQQQLDEALRRAEEHLSSLPHLQQFRRARARLEVEIQRAADGALHAVRKWKEEQLSQLTQQEARFSSGRGRVQERRKELEIAMQMAREVQRVPSLEQYCFLDKVLETLQAPVDQQCNDIERITMDSQMSCVFQSQCVNQCLTLSLEMKVSVPKQNCFSPTPEQPSPVAIGPSSRGSASWLRSSTSQPVSPDVIVEELLIEGRETDPLVNDVPPTGPLLVNDVPPTGPLLVNDVQPTGPLLVNDVPPTGPLLVNDVPPTGPQLANDNRRFHRRRSQSFVNKTNVAQWVVVSHVESPSNFYVRYVAEKRESDILSKKIKGLCSRRSCCFSCRDSLGPGSLVFVKVEQRVWCRATVVQVFPVGGLEAVKTCNVCQLARVQVFLLDSGLIKDLVLQGEEAPESSLKALDLQLRRVGNGVKMELDHFPPQATRCSLKDLVPYDPTRGWSRAAQQEFLSLVGSSALEMRPLGRDQDSLLVDLRKTPMEQASDRPISVREYLVFIEVARFYSPLKTDRRPRLYSPPQFPKMNTELNAVVTHTHSPADFYIQLVDNMEFVLLSAKLQDWYKEPREEQRVSVPVLHQACVALYEDRKWYRAQVTGHPGGRQVEVQYVDFGNKKLVSVSDLRKIKDEFFSVPSRAIHCCLSDVVPPDGDVWTEACRRRFISLAHQKLVIVMATGEPPQTQPLPVRLFESSLDGPLDSIAELLVQEQLASFTEGLEPPAEGEPAVWDPPLESGSALPAVEEAQSEEVLDLPSQLKLLHQLKDLNVRVSHVNSPSSFYVQLGQSGPQLQRMSELVEEQCEHLEHQDQVWELDQVCAARVQGVWERGRVLGLRTPNGCLQVMRCDHGIQVKLHVSDLRPLPTSFRGSLALECTLTDIRPAGGRPTWSATACDLISFYLTGASAVLTIKELTEERPVPVTLLRSNETGKLVSMADFLVSEGLGLRERKPRVVVLQDSKGPAAPPGTRCAGSDVDPVPPVPPTPQPRPAPRTVASAEKVETGPYRPPSLPGLGPASLRVTAVGEDGLLHARTPDAEAVRRRLGERLQQSMKTLPRQKAYTWRTVRGLAVRGPDMLWYRGQLLELLGGHVKVQDVDSGLVENIPVVHVYPTLLCDDTPQLSVSCQLHGIQPVGGRWQCDAVALLRELLLSRRVDVEVRALPADPRGPLTVEVFLDGLSLNRILTHLEHASVDRPVSPQKGHSEPSPGLLNEWDIDIQALRGPEDAVLGPFISPKLPQEGEPFQVKVKHLRTPNELFLWPLEGSSEQHLEGEHLEEALSRINDDMEATQHLTDMRQGGPCLAQYSDGRFYRARVDALSGVEPVRVLVQHVDFGSEDSLPPARLRRLPAALLRFPTRALEVRVSGFGPPSGGGEEEEEGAVLSYSPGWSLKATMDMLHMLHGHITAAIVAREPELTVLLYNEDGELVHLHLVSSGLAELE